MAYPCAWPIPVHGLSLCMTYPCAWLIPVHGLSLCMTYPCGWLIPVHSLSLFAIELLSFVSPPAQSFEGTRYLVAARSVPSDSTLLAGVGSRTTTRPSQPKRTRSSPPVSLQTVQGLSPIFAYTIPRIILLKRCVCMVCMGVCVYVCVCVCVCAPPPDMAYPHVLVAFAEYSQPQ